MLEAEERQILLCGKVLLHSVLHLLSADAINALVLKGGES